MDDNQLLRYKRHLLLPQIDVAGQQRLLDASVLVVGAGGLGSPVLLYLAATGIGKL
ncbi:MAG TPA: molybdopterin biosynthesis protein MoeB, partial [Gammaproteobacteria bacterium]|nr:molybdopterin biosynthesis protein MoeB [Gammaproteobacteria bacterium]